jgi:hypothetical protein
MMGLFLWFPRLELDSPQGQFGGVRTRAGACTEHAIAEKDEVRCLGGATNKNASSLLWGFFIGTRLELGASIKIPATSKNPMESSVSTPL